jgi:hypothetical protein
MMDRYEAEQRIRDLEAELAAANARIAELENIIAWAEPRPVLAGAVDPPATPGDDAHVEPNYQPGQNAHPEGKGA